MVRMVTVTPPSKAEAEVVDLVSALIRFDTSNTGEPETTKGEAECARWVAEQLEEVGYTTEYVEAGAPGRGNLFARLEGAEPRPRRPAAARAPRRGARRGVGLERASVLRRGRGRLRVGPRRGRHEGHGRHDDRGRPALQTRRDRAAAGSGVRVRLRRGGRREIRLRMAGRQPAGSLRRRHRGGRRGGRLLADDSAPRRR